MALKRLFIDIQGDLFDLWQFSSAERGPDEYNEMLGRMEYTLIINASAKMKDLEAKTYRYKNEDDRDNKLYDIKEMLMANPNIYFVGENDGTMNDDELRNAGYSKRWEKHEDTDDEE